MPDIEDFNFWPQAMLPAWFVSDADLRVRNYNPFAYEMLRSVGSEYLLANQYLSLRVDDLPSGECASLWKCLLDPRALQNLDYARVAIRILDQHVKIFHEFNQAGGASTVDELIKCLSAVTGLEEVVTPYVRRPLPLMDHESIYMGVRVSPPQGLKLIKPVALENFMVEYVDIVMAYRLQPEWSGGELSRVMFLGVQPAIHDATKRHQLWDQGIKEEHAQVTQFLSHALKTPISNIQSMARELSGANLTDYHRSVCEKLVAQINDLGNLSDLILFINTAVPLPITLSLSHSQDASIWEHISLNEIRDEVAKTLQSVCNGRTRDQQDIKKVHLLAGIIGASSAKAAVPDFEAIAEKMLDASELGEITTFGLLLPSAETSDYDVEMSSIVARRAKTTFLNLLLVELLLNAIKYADAKAPDVKLTFKLNTDRHRLEIGLINNGQTLSEQDFKHALKYLASRAGEKRQALGLLLNTRAAEILGWELECRALGHPGTHLVLSIPVRE